MGAQVWVMSLGSKFSTAFLLGGLHLFVQAAIKDGSPGMGNEPRLEMFDCISIRSKKIGHDLFVEAASEDGDLDDEPRLDVFTLRLLA